MSDTQLTNMKIWDQVSKTDTSATKSAKVNGQQISSIDGYWVIQQATKLFGPIGIGWGYDVIEERWDDGKPFGVKQEDGSVNTIITKTHTIKLKLWYMLDGQRGEITQYGHTQAIYRSSYGVSDDGEAPKKSLMDAIKKSLSMLGFCADVFMGQFDQPEYREQLEVEQAIAKAEDREKEIEDRRSALIAEVTSSLETLKKSTSAHEAKKIYTSIVRHLGRQQQIPSLRDIAERGIKQAGIESENIIKSLGDKANG